MVDYRLSVAFGAVAVTGLLALQKQLEALYPGRRALHWIGATVCLVIVAFAAFFSFQAATGKEIALGFDLVPLIRRHWGWFLALGVLSPLVSPLYRALKRYRGRLRLHRPTPAAPALPRATTYRPAEIARPRGERQPKAAPEAIPAGDQLPFANSPKELKAYLQGLTPGKRSKIAPQYVGLEVVWSGNLRHVEKPSMGSRKISVNLDGAFRDEFFTAFVADDPELDDVPEGGRVRIAGEIMTLHELTLNSARLLP